MKIKDFIYEYRTLKEQKKALNDKLKELELVSIQRYDLIDEKVSCTGYGNGIERSLINKIDKMNRINDDLMLLEIDLIKYDVVLDILSDTESRVFQMIYEGYRHIDVKQALYISMNKLKEIIEGIETKMDYVTE